MDCPKCGGIIEGDGYSVVYHCEYADEEDYINCEPDANIVLCRFKEENT